MTLAAHRHFENLAAYEWVLVGLAALIGAWSIWMAVLYTLRPGEDEPDHVKRSILDDPVLGDRVAIRVAAAKTGATGAGAPRPEAGRQLRGGALPPVPPTDVPRERSTPSSRR